MNSLELSIYKVMSSVNKDSFISSYQFWMIFLSFSLPIALDRTFLE